ncbi:PilZ domain-containing protein, partial [Dissulfurirhabdus thermomarina]
MGEHRRSRRVRFRRRARVVALDRAAPPVESDRTRDISLTGFYCYTPGGLPVGTACLVELRLSGMSSDLVLRMNGEVVRRDREGMGIRFRSLDSDSRFHLEHILEELTALAADVYGDSRAPVPPAPRGVA